MLSALASATINQADLTNTQVLKTQANVQLNNLPGIARSLLGDSKINVEYTPVNGSVINYGITLDEGLVDNIQLTSLTNSNLDIYLSENALNQISNSANPRQEAKTLIRNRTIRYQAHGFVTRLKINMALRFL